MPQPDDTITFDPGPAKSWPIKVPDHVYVQMASALIASVDMDTDHLENNTYRTDLDSHANMPVVGANVLILNELDKTAEVSAFTPDYDPMEIPIVDAALKYSITTD